MMKREEIIKGLEMCSADGIGCKNCPYYCKETQMYSCGALMQKDALMLIKADEQLMDKDVPDDFDTAYFAGFNYGGQIMLKEIMKMLKGMKWYGGSKQVKRTERMPGV